MLFWLQFSTSLACGIEQIAEHVSLFHIKYIYERGWHAQQYMWCIYIYTYMYVIADQNH